MIDFVMGYRKDSRPRFLATVLETDWAAGLHAVSFTSQFQPCPKDMEANRNRIKTGWIWHLFICPPNWYLKIHTIHTALLQTEPEQVLSCLRAQKMCQYDLSQGTNGSDYDWNEM